VAAGGKKCLTDVAVRGGEGVKSTVCSASRWPLGFQLMIGRDCVLRPGIVRADAA